MGNTTSSALDEAVRHWMSADPEPSIPATARQFGVAASSLWRRIHPERTREYNRRDAARKRRWEREHRAMCACGRPLGVSSGRADGSPSRAAPQRCAECHETALAERRVEVLRLRVIENLSNRQIAHQLDTTPQAVASILSRWRKQGIDVPRDPYMTGRRGV